MSKNILLIVEGKKREPDLIKAMFKVYGLADTFEIFSFKTNIHALYELLNKNGGNAGFDLILSLKSICKTDEEKEILCKTYTDIVLVFDFDPNDRRYEAKRIQELVEYFSDSTDNGKLYINYPMVESFFRLRNISDADYLYSKVPREKMKNSSSYRIFVTSEPMGNNINRYPTSLEEWNRIIKANIHKSAIMVSQSNTRVPAPQPSIFSVESSLFASGEDIYELCTCIFFIPDYQPKLLNEDRQD